MLDRMLKHNPAASVLSFFTVALLVSATSVHPQTTSPSDAASGSMMQKGSGSTKQSTPSATPSSGASGTGNTSGSSDTSAAGAASTANNAAAKQAGVSTADRNLMRELAMANLAEIETAKLAQSKTSNEQVRSFAQRMIDDHTKAMEQLQQLAQAKGVQLPTSPDAKHQAMMKKLSALSGDGFDKQYLSQAGVADHQKAHQLVARVSSRAQDPDLKALGSQLLPTIDQHLQLAQQASSGKAGNQSAGQTSSGK
jgi:putative membrane protein